METQRGSSDSAVLSGGLLFGVCQVSGSLNGGFRILVTTPYPRWVMFHLFKSPLLASLEKALVFEALQASV